MCKREGFINTRHKTSTEIQFSEKLYPNKLDNVDEMDQFLGMYDLPTLGQKEIKNLNRHLQTKVQDQMASQQKSTRVPGWLRG